MATLYPFRTEYTRNNFHHIVTDIEEAAYNQPRCEQVILPAFLSGLAACDGAAESGMTVSDIYDVAYTLHIDQDCTAHIESFVFGAATAIMQSLNEAATWMLIDEEDYIRIASHCTAVTGINITVADVYDMPTLDAVMALLDSYIVTPEPGLDAAQHAHPATNCLHL